MCTLPSPLQRSYLNTKMCVITVQCACPILIDQIQGCDKWNKIIITFCTVTIKEGKKIIVDNI